MEFCYSSSQGLQRKRKNMSQSEGDSESAYAKQRCLEQSGCFLFIKMELMAMDLQQWMWKTKIRRRAVVRDMMGGILSALAYIHKEGYMHRDLTPRNIFVSDENIVKIGDFGLAKRCNPEDILNEEHHTFGIGVQLYLSPEYMESRPYSCPVDVYAAGIIWVELLNYFSTDQERYEVLSGLKKGFFPTNFCAKFPEEYDIIASMLAEDPDARPTAEEACTRLKPINHMEKHEDESVLKQRFR